MHGYLPASVSGWCVHGRKVLDTVAPSPVSGKSRKRPPIMRIFETAESFDLPDPRVWVSGDWHSNAGWVQTLLPALRRRDPEVTTVLQLGDYGFSHAGPGISAVDYWSRRAGIERVFVTLGNHESWGEITAAQDATPGRAIRVSDVVWLLPRPFRFTVGGRTVLSLGGAASIDRQFRTPGVDWWEAENSTEQMVSDAISGGPADLMLTHDSPQTATPAVRDIIAGSSRRIAAEALEASAASRDKIEQVWNAARPKLLLHGHMHVYDELTAADRRVISLNRDTWPGNAGLLNLETLAFAPLSLLEIRQRH